ncbi:hypothetical protein OROGR_017411 [Orobanche gracilis]
MSCFLPNSLHAIELPVLFTSPRNFLRSVGFSSSPATHSIGPSSTCFSHRSKKSSIFMGIRVPEKSQVQDCLDDVATSVSPSEKLEAFENFLRNGEVQTISKFNRLLMCLVAADEFELAMKLKSNLSSIGLYPDNWTYSILVDCYCKKNDPIEARSVLDHMLADGFEPNVFDIMSRIGCEFTVNTYNCLIKGLCYVGRVEEAFELMASIKNSSMKPDIYTYTTMMDGFCKVGRSSEALGLLNEALEMGINPNVVTYNTLFNGYFKEGRPLCGFGLLRRMEEGHCSPDYISYSTLLHGLLKWGKIKAARDIYKKMVETGLRVDERMMNTLLRGLCRRSRKEKELLRDVYYVFEELRERSYAVYAGAYDLVVEAFCNGRDTDMAFENLNEMIRIGHSPKTFTFNIVIFTLCSVGEVDKALAVLMLMHKNRKPSGIPFSFLIDELNQEGRSVEACNVYGMALKRGVLPKIYSCSAPDELSSRELENLLKMNKVDNNELQQASDERTSTNLQTQKLTQMSHPPELTRGNKMLKQQQKHPRHRPGCSCIVCIQPPSGTGRHKPTCICNVCMTIRRRFNTLMMRKKERQSEREAEIAHGNQIVSAAAKEDTGVDRRPGSQENTASSRVSMMGLLQEASLPLEKYLRQNGLTSLVSDQQLPWPVENITQAQEEHSISNVVIQEYEEEGGNH